MNNKRFVWRRIYTRLVLYAIAILLIVFFFTSPAKPVSISADVGADDPASGAINEMFNALFARANYQHVFDMAGH